MEGGQRPRTSAAGGGRRGGRRASRRSSSRSWRARSSAAHSPRATSCRPSPRSASSSASAARSSARALKLLEERGLVRVEQGRGTTVQPRERLEPARPGRAPHRPRARPRHVAARRPDHRPPACSSARWHGRGRASDRRRARRARREPRADGRSPTTTTSGSARSTCAFHAVVMKASGNEVGLTIVRVIHRHGGMTPPLSAGAARELLEQTASEHRGIYDALAAARRGRSPATGSPCTSNRPGRRRKDRAERLDIG